MGDSDGLSSATADSMPSYLKGLVLHRGKSNHMNERKC